MLSKTILVGEAPPKSRMRDSPTSLPFSGSAGRRLSELIGQDVTQAFETRNLIPEWPGQSHHGSLFPIVKARSGVVELLRTLPFNPPARLIFAGGRVAKAFKLGNLSMLEWRQIKVGFRGAPGGNHWFEKRLWVAKIPHPSGVNRWWNEPGAEDQVREFLLAELERS